MPLRPRAVWFLAIAAAAALAVSACSSQGINVASRYRSGAELFLTHCSGCHSLSVVGAEGSASSIPGRLRNQAPDFNFRKEDYPCVLYAIENGGFSGQIMPQDIVVGAQAKAVARFLARYSGLKAPKELSLTGPPGACGS
jgi:cytochrome c551